MEIGNVYEMRVTDVSTSGEGIGRADNIVTFVPGLVPGDEAEVEITGMKKNTARGKLLKLLRPSPDRTEPVCPQFGQCGGCTLQNMKYEAQLALKQRQLMDKLRRIGAGEVPDPDPEPAGGMLSPWRYRNKAEYAVGWGRRGDGSKGPVVGFYDRGSRRVVEAPDCLIQSPAAVLAADALRRFIEEAGVSVYNERTGRGLLRRMIVRTGWESGEIMVTLTINGKELPEAQLFADILSEFLDTEDYELRSIALEYNSRNNLAEPGAKTEVIAGGNVINDVLTGRHFEISPQSFYQVNPEQTALLYQTVLDFAEIGPEDVIFDLYCGVGTIGIFCAGSARYVWGIESVKSAVIDANRNAVLNGLVNIQFLHGKAEEKIYVLTAQDIYPDVVILDPPRSGCRPELVEEVCRLAPKRVIYVSCEPATLARDLKLFAEAGAYQLRRVKLIDQFCQTVRSECVSLLTRTE